MSPPSCKILDAFNLQREIPDKQTICEVAKDILLPEQEVTFWIEHVNQIHLNRKSGAEKAAKTRMEKRHEVENVGRRKRTSSKQGCGESSDDTSCATCSMVDPTGEEEDSPVLWISCDGCCFWHHLDCLGLEKAPEKWICLQCVEEW